MDRDAVAELNANLGPFAEAVGATFDTCEPDRLTGHVDIDERHHQPFGLVHGGVWCSIVEQFGSVAAAASVRERGEVVVGVSNQTDFLRPVRSGRIDIVATPLQRGRLQHLWLVEMLREDGKPVARGHLRAQVLPADRV